MEPTNMAIPGDPSLVELRGDVSREVIDVIDAVAKAKRRSRMEIVELVLREWADAKRHESTLVLRLSRREGSAAEH